MIRGGGTTSADVVLAWYGANGRDLAFRHTSDPWAILVSEVMAQQTQAARAAEAWTRFMHRYPTPASLAAASPAEALCLKMVKVTPRLPTHYQLRRR